MLGSYGEGPGIFLFAHTDTEPPDPRGAWDTDPYRATEVGNRIYGVGAADDKAGVVSVLAAARALLPHLAGVRLVVGLVHSKLGGGLGTLPTIARVGNVDTSIYCHPAETGQGMTHFKIATRGFFNFRIETVGRRPDPVEIRTPNSEDPRQGVNAFTRLRRVLDEVDRWADREGMLCSVNWISAGINPITLPEHAVAEGSVWFRHGTVSEVYEGLNQCALGAGALSTQLFGLQSNPAEIPPDHPLVTATNPRDWRRNRNHSRRIPGPCSQRYPLSDPLPERRHGGIRRQGRKLLWPQRVGGCRGHAPRHPSDSADRFCLGRPGDQR